MQGQPCRNEGFDVRLAFHAGYEKNQAGMSLHRVGEPLIKPRHRAARKTVFRQRIPDRIHSDADSLLES